MRVGLFSLLALLFAGCATPGYVLHSRAPTGFGNFLKPPRENTLISQSDEVALLYDRAPWVIYENRLGDESVWVHYSINVKNNGTTPQEFLSRKVYLLGA